MKVSLASLAIILAACSGTASTSSPGKPSPSPSASPSASPLPSPSSSISVTPSPIGSGPGAPGAASYKEYGVAACAAWEALFRAVGNPDTATGSDLSRALDTAVAARDVAAAERLAADITRELKAGRAQVAIAGGWQPRTTTMVEFDRVFAGYDAMIAAKLAAAKREPSSTPVDGGYPDADSPQAAFERAGGLEGYFAMIDLIVHASPPPGETARTCGDLPVTMP